MDIVHEPIEIPVVRSASADDDIKSFVAFVLTAAICGAPGLVEAEWDGRAQGTVSWTARRLGDAQSARLIISQNKSYFRTTLAHINAQLLNGQLYGGAIRRVFTQAGTRVIAAVHTSNEGATGFWIRIAVSNAIMSGGRITGNGEADPRGDS